MKYNVWINETHYYMSKEIEADSREEALHEYIKLWENGNVEVNESDIVSMQTEDSLGVVKEHINKV